MPQTQQLKLNRHVCRKVISEPDTPAFAWLVAAASLLGEQALFDEDDQPEDALILARELREEVGTAPPEMGVHRLMGLLYAASGDEYYTRLRDFQRMTDAITDGDAFASDDGEIDLEDVFWALYQLELTVESSFLPVEELAPQILTWIEKLVDSQAQEEDLPIEDLDDAEDFFSTVLMVRKKNLGLLLIEMGVDEESLADLDPSLLPV